MEDRLDVPEDDFWSLVRAEIRRHQARFDELKERYEPFDLLGERIARLCLNRNGSTRTATATVPTARTPCGTGPRPTFSTGHESPSVCARCQRGPVGLSVL
nr:IucA/IucC family C-terminal-domain containing protein [Streptomyces yangpuensis]